MTRQTPTVPRHPELDELTVHWRIAFNAADDAVGALAHGGGTVALPEAQLAALRREIADQRVATARAQGLKIAPGFPFHPPRAARHAPA